MKNYISFGLTFIMSISCLFSQEEILRRMNERDSLLRANTNIRSNSSFDSQEAKNKDAIKTFYYTKSDDVILTKEITSYLVAVVKYMNENPKSIIEIFGHSDNSGSKEDNLKWSNERASNVMNYLITNNIDKKRITAKGFGDSKPFLSNNNEEGRKKNRRIEILIKI